MAKSILEQLGISPSMGGGTALPGQGMLTFSPTAVSGGAPTYRSGDPASLMAAMGAGSMGAGWVRQGAAAFMPGDLNFSDMDWSPVTSQYGEGGQQESNLDEYNSYLRSFQRDLSNVANNFGYDISGYDLNDIGALGGQRADPRYQSALRNSVSQTGREAGTGNLQNLLDDLNTDLSGFYRMRGASSGWDGRGDPRSTATTMYYRQPNGDMVPISESQFGRKPEHQGWAREDGAELIRGLSMVMPAFGGWAGLLGSGTAGTVTGVTGGLGLTTGIPSAIVNAGMGAALGGGTNGLLGSLGGYLGGLGASELGLPTNLGSQLGRGLTNYLTSQSGSRGSGNNGLQGLVSAALGASGVGSVGGSGGSSTGASGNGLAGSASASGAGGSSRSGGGLAGLLSLLGGIAAPMGFIDPNPKDEETKDTVSDVVNILRDSKGKVIV